MAFMDIGTAGRFRITQTAISPSHIGISQSRGHAATALHREARRQIARPGRHFWSACAHSRAASLSGGGQDRQTQNSSASAYS